MKGGLAKEGKKCVFKNIDDFIVYVYINASRLLSLLSLARMSSAYCVQRRHDQTLLYQHYTCI